MKLRLIYCDNLANSFSPPLRRGRGGLVLVAFLNTIAIDLCGLDAWVMLTALQIVSKWNVLVI